MNRLNFLFEVTKYLLDDYIDNEEYSLEDAQKQQLYWSSKVILNLMENAYDWEVNLFNLSLSTLRVLFVRHARRDKNDLFRLLAISSKISFNDSEVILVQKLNNVVDNPSYITNLYDITTRFIQPDKFVKLLPFIEALRFIRISFDKDAYPKLWKYNGSMIPDTVVIHKAFDELGENASMGDIMKFYIDCLPKIPDSLLHSH